MDFQNAQSILRLSALRDCPCDVIFITTGLCMQPNFWMVHLKTKSTIIPRALSLTLIPTVMFLIHLSFCINIQQMQAKFTPTLWPKPRRFGHLIWKPSWRCCFLSVSETSFWTFVFPSIISIWFCIFMLKKTMILSQVGQMQILRQQIANELN